MKPVDWADDTSFSIDVSTEQAFLGAKKASRSLTFLTSSTAAVRPMKSILEFGLTKFRSRAYLHWYKGVEEEDFKEAFSIVQDIVDAYDCCEY